MFPYAACNTWLALTLRLGSRALLEPTPATLSTSAASRTMLCWANIACSAVQVALVTMASAALPFITRLLISRFFTVLTDALLRAQSDGMDIISLSLGGPGGWAGEATAVVASRIADMGDVVTIAQGEITSLSFRRCGANLIYQGTMATSVAGTLSRQQLDNRLLQSLASTSEC